jgi:SAM-dependent MidA family methyltransferase
MDAQLPPPSADAQAASRTLSALIAAEIDAGGGWIPFSRYMELALYAPGLGYYSGGSRKFGEEGDFLTAPEITPLFGQALARQVAQVTAASASAVLEAGAGSGRLAADLLNALADLGCTPERYFILELSGELRARQQETIAREAPAQAARIEWLDRLPETFSGCVLANELLDALPAEAVAWRREGRMERGVAVTSEGFAWAERPAPAVLASAMAQLQVTWPFTGEIGLAARAWTAEWGWRMEAGALLLIDYGLPRQEFYHPQRDTGTLRCHYRHRVHQDPFWWPGLSDVTCHVDFTAVAEAGHEAGLDVLGYTSQANFLMNCGLGELLAGRQAAGGEQAARAMGAASLLLSPNEMGELFKVIALGRRMKEPLLGFAQSDRLHTL